MNSNYQTYEGATLGPINAATGTATGKALDVGSFGNVLFKVATSGTATLTVQFKVSISETKPDFSSAASRTNPWTYVQVKNRDTDAALNGATGVVFTGADAVYLVSMNTNRVRWVCPCVTAYTQGTVDVDAFCANNI